MRATSKMVGAAEDELFRLDRSQGNHRSIDFESMRSVINAALDAAPKSAAKGPTHKQPGHMFRYADEFLAAWQTVYRPVLERDAQFSVEYVASLGEDIHKFHELVLEVEQSYLMTRTAPKEVGIR